jgi:intracellular septation protein A
VFGDTSNTDKDIKTVPALSYFKKSQTINIHRFVFFGNWKTVVFTFMKYMYLKKTISYVALGCAYLLGSCSHYSPELQRALECAGSNRTELEKVLEHYA